MPDMDIDIWVTCSRDVVGCLRHRSIENRVVLDIITLVPWLPGSWRDTGRRPTLHEADATPVLVPAPVQGRHDFLQ